MLLKFRRALMALTIVMAYPAIAQVTQPQEYEKFVGRATAIDAFVDFGDQVNLRDGGLTFKMTDVEVTGIGPAIRITRTFRPGGLGQYFHETSGNGFGAWELEIPRIKTITSNTLGASIYSPLDWQVAGSTTTQKNARCTRFSAPDRISFPRDSARGWEAYEWWHGYQFVDDSGNEQSVMSRAPTSIRSDLPLMTTGNWLIGCLPTTANGAPGEAFYAISPDGTKYWLNQLVYTQADYIEKPLWSEWTDPPYLMASGAQKIVGPTPTLAADVDSLSRRYAAMLVTRVEDRFGNWVTYHYTGGKLDSIDASDGRHVSIAYGPAGSATVTVGTGLNARVWTYSYTAASPSTDGVLQQLVVTRPDGSKWQYALNWQVPLSFSAGDLEGTPTCPFDATEDPVTVSQSVTSPAGSKLDITLVRRRFGRSFVLKECFNPKPGFPNTGIMKYPNEWFSYAVSTRTVSGPGVSTATWNYSYAPATSSWLQDCQTASSCASTVWTDVVNPSGERRRSIFSNKFDETENKLLREEEYSASGALLQSKDYTYATVPQSQWTANPYPWPVQVGYDQQVRQNVQTSGQWAPVRKVVTTRQGKTFTWEVPFLCGSGASPCFDSFARPTRVTKSSSP